MRLHLSLVLIGAALFQHVHALWPAPMSMTNGLEAVKLAERFEIGFLEGSRLEREAPQDLLHQIVRTQEQLKNDQHGRMIVGRGETDRSDVEAADTLTALVLSLSARTVATAGPILSISEEANKLYEDQDESYTLLIPSQPISPLPFLSPSPLEATLTANTTLGLLRGLQTFSQLVYTLPSSPSQLYIPFAPLKIDDRPAFPHRGFMLDTARNFFPVEDILRTLDAMSYAKLNVFHWHATDSQSWPFTIPSFPLLTSSGAYSPSEIYSEDDIDRIERYAGALGISVLLEIDVPGHTAIVAEGYPEMVTCLGKENEWPKFAAEPPTGQLKLGDRATQAFAEELMRSAAGLMRGRYFSSGGDEVNERCYLEDPVTSVALKNGNTTLDDLLSHFVGGVHDVLRTAGKTPVVWEEMVLSHSLSLAPSTIVMVWISSANVRAVVEQGLRVIHAASDYFYLDCGAGGWLGNGVGTRVEKSWCDPFKTWQKAYSFDPYANLTESQRPLILGGQSLLWSEQASPENLDHLAWPRAAAAAEVFWTGTSRGSVRDALPRLHDWRYRAVRRGIKASPLQPHYCALRPGKCDWVET